MCIRDRLSGSHNSGQGICLLAAGVHTTVKARECWLSGGLVTAAVHAGAHLDARRTMLSASEIIGVEVKGVGARLSMAENCRVENMGRAYRGAAASTKGYWCRAVYAHAAAAVELKGLTVRAVEWGIHVRGASASVQDCSVSRCMDVCMRVSRGSQAVMTRSVLDLSLIHISEPTRPY